MELQVVLENGRENFVNFQSKMERKRNTAENNKISAVFNEVSYD